MRLPTRGLPLFTEGPRRRVFSESRLPENDRSSIFSGEISNSIVSAPSPNSVHIRQSTALTSSFPAFKVGWRDQKSDEPNRTRTLIEAARRYTGKPSLMKTPENLSRWSKEYEWASRAREWDRHLQRRKDEALVVRQEEAIRESAVSMGDIESEHIRLGYNIIQKMFAKMDDPGFWTAFKPKDLTARIRAVNELISAIAKSRPEGYKEEVEHERPLSTEERARVDELFRQITGMEEEEEK